MTDLPDTRVGAPQSARRAWLPLALRERLGRHPRFAAFVANSTWLILDRAVRALLGLLVGAWVARHLGPSDYGLLAFALAYIALFQAVVSLGADSIIVRNLAQDGSSAGRWLGTAFALRLAAGVFAWTSSTAIAAIAFDSQLVILTVIVGGTLVFQAADTVDLWFQSQSQSRRTVLVKLSVFLVSAGAKVALVLGRAPLEAFALVIALEAGAAAAALACAYRRQPAGMPWRPEWPAVKALLRESWPLMASGLAIMAYMRADQILVGRLLGAKELGIYAAVLPISQFWQVIPLAVATSLAPMVAQLRLTDEAAYRRVLVTMFGAFFHAGLACALVTLAFSEFIIECLLGAEYSEGAAVLAIHGFSNTFVFLGIAHGLWVTNERRFAVRLVGTVLAGVTALGLTLLLLPRVGLIGVAYASVAAQCVAALLINALMDREGLRLQIKGILFRRSWT